MKPAAYDFPALTRGDTEVLAIVVKDQDVDTLEVRPSLKSGDVVEWRVAIQGQPDRVRSTRQGEGLALDLALSLVTWTLTADDWTALAAASAFPYRVRILRADGAVQTYLTGTLTVAG